MVSVVLLNLGLQIAVAGAVALLSLQLWVLQYKLRSLQPDVGCGHHRNGNIMAAITVADHNLQADLYQLLTSLKV